MAGTNTPKLDLLRIQETWQFGDEAFNRFIDDADDKLVGVEHLESPKHWTDWKKETVYAKEDIVRITNGKSHQYYQCIVGGTSGTSEPTNNVTGSIITDGTVQWMVMSLSEAGTNGGTIKIWLSGTYYNRGEAVLYGTSLYRCKVDHTATTWVSDYIYWQEVFASIRLWKPTIYYFEDDTVIQDDIIYKCNTAHVSGSSFDATEEANWDAVGGAGGANPWESSKMYQAGQFVVNDGILYRAKDTHASGSFFSGDLSHWDSVNTNIVVWSQNSYYPVGSLVQYGNIVYKCTTSHTASSNFNTDISSWSLFHNTISVWGTSKPYYTGQIIIYDNRLYRCNISHVSSTFSSDMANWTALDASIAVWGSNTVYKIGDVVLYDNEPFRCVKDHTSGNTNIFSDITNNVSTNCWDYIGNKNSFIIPWQANKLYNTNQVVTYNNTLYRCNSLHVSGSSFSSSGWDLVYANIQPWATGTLYKVNSSVLNDGRLYICTTEHTSSVFNTDSSNWIEIGGSSGISDWVSGVSYAKDSVVLYDGVLYRCNTVHTSSSAFSTDISNWDMVYSNIPVWNTSKYYPLDILVSYNNIVYKCTTAHMSSSNFETDRANWMLFHNIPANISPWASNTYYYASQCIVYDGVLYRANTNHTSSSSFSTDSANWDMVYANIAMYANNTFYKAGREVIYNKNLYRCLADHTSNTDTIGIVKFYDDNSTFISMTSAESPPKSYTLDLGDEKTITEIAFTHGGGKHLTFTEIDIATSTDNVDFTTVYHYTNPSLSSYSVDAYIYIYSVGRYIKITITNTYYEGGYGQGTASADSLKVWVEDNNWELIGSKSIYVSFWESDKIYKENDIVIYGDEIYKCMVSNYSSSSFSLDSAKWTKISDLNVWSANTFYKQNTLIYNQGKLYKATSDFTSGITFDVTNLEVLTGFALNNWQENTTYSAGDIFVAESTLYRVLNGFTSGATFSETSDIEGLVGEPLTSAEIAAMFI